MITPDALRGGLKGEARGYRIVEEMPFDVNEHVTMATYRMVKDLRCSE